MITRASDPRSGNPARGKFVGDTFTYVGADPINGERYLRDDGATILVWFDRDTRLWAVYALCERCDNQRSTEAQYIVKADVPWAIEYVDTSAVYQCHHYSEEN